MSVQRNSKHYHAYYDHANGRKKASGSIAKVYDIISDLTDRRGLRQEWEEIDGDIQDEIIAKWKEIIDKA
ncbi:MAG TPA: hypothetical protein VK172_10255 [Lentimicrobium sp.]|nr:hypothetical protein [Lentimicrobium sp.]